MNQRIKAYHASLDDFDDFHVTEQGIHFGSKVSALEAVMRKIHEDHHFFYLYTVELDTSEFIEEFDQGHDWRRSFEHEPESVKGYVYTNKYEPSIHKSYVTWHTSTITLVRKEVIQYE